MKLNLSGRQALESRQDLLNTVERLIVDFVDGEQRSAKQRHVLLMRPRLLNACFELLDRRNAKRAQKCRGRGTHKFREDYLLLQPNLRHESQSPCQRNLRITVPE